MSLITALGMNPTDVKVAGTGGQYATITAALAAATSGQTVLVLPGTYTESVVVPDGVSLMGAGTADRTIITGTGNGTPLVSLCGNNTMRDVSVVISGTGYSGAPVHLFAPNVLIDRCIVNGGVNGSMDMIRTYTLLDGYVTIQDTDILNWNYDCINISYVGSSGPGLGFTLYVMRCRFLSAVGQYSIPSICSTILAQAGTPTFVLLNNYVDVRNTVNHVGNPDFSWCDVVGGVAHSQGNTLKYNLTGTANIGLFKTNNGCVITSVNDYAELSSSGSLYSVYGGGSTGAIKFIGGNCLKYGTYRAGGSNKATVQTMGIGADLSITSGALNARAGTATLVAGTVTVATKEVTASSRIMISRNTAGGTVGNLSLGAITAATNFVIQSDNANDVSTVNWMILEPV